MSLLLLVPSPNRSRQPSSGPPPVYDPIGRTRGALILCRFRQSSFGSVCVITVLNLRQVCEICAVLKNLICGYRSSLSCWGACFDLYPGALPRSPTDRKYIMCEYIYRFVYRFIGSFADSVGVCSGR